MFRKQFFIVFWIGCSTLFAQQVELRGTVQDSLGAPLPYVNLIAGPADSTYQKAFAITDEKGRYVLDLHKNVAYQIVITHLGYKKIQDTLRLTNDQIRNFRLVKIAENLDEVLIKTEMAVIVKEDTITYRTDKFKTGDERKLREILKKLPGVEVDRHGNVTVNGKKVTKLMIDGKDFFGGDTKLGVNNIPVDAIAEIEIIDDYHAVAFMKGLSESDAMAMNIKLKKGKEHFLFGESQAGGGIENRYMLKPTLFYYSPKTTLNFIGSLNNNGKAPLDNQTVKRFRNGNMYSNYMPIASGNEGLYQFSDRNDILFQKTGFGALNFTQTLSPKLKLSAYGLAAHQKTKGLTTNDILYLTQNLLQEQREQTNEDRSFSSFNKLKLRYQPNGKSDMAYHLLINAINKNTLENIRSQTGDSIHRTRTSLEPKQMEIKQYFRYNRQHSYEHTTEIKVNYTYNRTTGNSDWLFDRLIFPDIIPAEENRNDYHFLHEYAKTTHQATLNYKHYWVLNRFSHLYPIAGLYFSNQAYKNTDYQSLNNGSANNFFNAGFNNDTGFQLIDPYIGLQYKFKIKDFTFRPGLVYHHYLWKINQFGLELTQTNKGVLLPEFMAKYSSSSAGDIEFNYSLKSSFQDVNAYANRLRLTDFNRIFRGNAYLENSLYHELTLNYRDYDMYRGLSFYVNFDYRRSEESIQNTINLEGTNQIGSLTQINFPENSYGFSGKFSKKWDSYKISLRASARLNEYSRLINEIKSDYTTNDYQYRLYGQTQFKQLPNLELGFSHGFSTLKSDDLQREFMTLAPYAHFRYAFLNGFIVKMSYLYTYYKNRTIQQSNQIQVGNASIFYQADGSPWGFEILAENIFNVRYKNSNSFNEFIVYDRRTYLQPRTVLFVLSYQL